MAKPPHKKPFPNDQPSLVIQFMLNFHRRILLTTKAWIAILGGGSKPGVELSEDMMPQLLTYAASEQS